MILVTGATGNVGGHVVARLREAGEAVRVLARSPGKARERFGSGVEVIAGDLDHPASVAAAVEGVRAIFLNTVPSAEMAAQHRTVAEAARVAGVERIVKLSALGAARNSRLALARRHHEGETIVAASGLAWTVLQPSFFLTNLLGSLGSIRAEGRIYAPAGNGPVGFVAPEDIAAVAAVALGGGHDGQTYVVTGGATYTYADTARILGAVIGKEVTHVDIPRADAKAGLLAAGLDEEFAEDLMLLMDVIKAGYAKTVTDVVPRVTGRPAISMEDWARDVFAPAYRAAG